MQSINQMNLGQYPNASNLAVAAFVLSNLSVVMTLLLWLMIVGLVVAYSDGRAGSTCYSVRYDGSEFRKWLCVIIIRPLVAFYVFCCIYRLQLANTEESWGRSNEPDQSLHVSYIASSM